MKSGSNKNLAFRFVLTVVFLHSQIFFFQFEMKPSVPDSSFYLYNRWLGPVDEIAGEEQNKISGN